MSEIDGYAKWGLGSARMGLYNFSLASHVFLLGLERQRSGWATTVVPTLTHLRFEGRDTFLRPRYLSVFFDPKIKEAPFVGRPCATLL